MCLIGASVGNADSSEAEHAGSTQFESRIEILNARVECINQRLSELREDIALLRRQVCGARVFRIISVTWISGMIIITAAILLGM